ncbi:transposable element Tcb1 transposase [Trichonephila clavipes]|nr:transposable element Tcb1 transposase [Trichonephila clavipes]
MSRRKQRSAMSRRKQRSAFDQVSEFDRGRIVAYRDWGLSFWKIADWSVRKTSIAWSTLDAEPQTSPPPMDLVSAIFQQDNVRPHVARIVQRFFVNHQIELLPRPALSPDLSPIENMWSMVVQRLTQITPPAVTPDQLWQRVEAAWSAVPQEHIQSL